MSSSDSQYTRPVGYFALLAGNPDYRFLWSGEVISLFGDWFNLIASAALIARLTQSGLAVGGLFVVRMLAPFLISPLAGVAADRYNRKQLLVFTDLARAAVVLGFLLVRQPELVWLLYTLTAVQLALSGIFYPARNAILPEIVQPAALGTANALSSATWSVMLALGAAVGGLVAGSWGIYPPFVIDSATFVVSALFLSRIYYRPSRDGIQLVTSLEAAGQQYLEGLRFLKSVPDILIIAMQKGAWALTVSGVFQVVQVVLAERVYRYGTGGSTGLGLLYAAAGVGTGLGPILARRISGDRPQALRRWMLYSYIITVLGLALTAPLFSFSVVLVGSILRSIGGGINWVFSTQLLLQLVPGRVRGRVFATEYAFFTLSSATGAAFAGFVFDRAAVGISMLLWGLAGVAAVPGILWLVWMLREAHGSAQLKID